MVFFLQLCSFTLNFLFREIYCIKFQFFNYLIKRDFDDILYKDTLRKQKINNLNCFRIRRKDRCIDMFRTRSFVQDQTNFQYWFRGFGLVLVGEVWRVQFRRQVRRLEVIRVLLYIQYCFLFLGGWGRLSIIGGRLLLEYVIIIFFFWRKSQKINSDVFIQLSILQ